MEKKLIAVVLIAVIGGVVGGYLGAKIEGMGDQTWHEVTRVSDTFHTRGLKSVFVNISSDHWMIWWGVSIEDPPPNDLSFWLWLKKEELPTSTLCVLTLADFDAIGRSEKMGTEFITGSGRFQIAIEGQGIGWAIHVWEYH